MDVRRTHPPLVDDAYRRVLDAFARTTTERELFAELCAAAVARDGIEHATVATPGADVVVARGRQVSGQTFSVGLADDDGLYATLTLHRTDVFTPEEIAWARELGAAAELIRGLRQTITNRFRRALAGSELALFMMDRELRYTWLEAPSVVNPETVIGRTDAELMPLGGADELTELKRRVIEHGEHVAQEIAVGDRCFWVSARPVRDAAGEVVGLAGQSINVTARKYAERELDRIASAADHGADAVDLV